MRMFDQELASKIRQAFNIDLAFSTSAQAAPLFATSSSDHSIINSFYVGEQLQVMARLEIVVGSQLIGKRIGDIGAEHRVFFLVHTRDGQETHFPPANTNFQPGDQIIVQTTPETLKLIHRWNGDEMY